jgi:hypothetical protein
MPYRVVYTPEAGDQLEALYLYIAERLSPKTAARYTVLTNVNNLDLHYNNPNVIVRNNVKTESTMPALLTAVQRYIQEVLGIATPEAKPWSQAGELPHFLNDTFQFREIELLGQSIILALPNVDSRQSLSDVRTWLNRVRSLADRPAVYVTDALASYERRRLIELKVPFIVPGNQLYLPDLGLDLREYFRQRATAAEALSPSVQAMLISALLRQPWEPDWRPAATAAQLGYSSMTLSRAVKELTGAGLATLHTEGRSRWLHLEGSPQTIWERAKPAMRTPVRNTFWVAEHSALAGYEHRMAGLSALARHSMLAEPRWRVYAITATDWRTAAEAGVRTIPEPVAGAQEWQVWSYSPALVPDAPTVDPLSLTLSLRDNVDDRVQLALDELQEQFPW